MSLVAAIAVLIAMTSCATSPRTASTRSPKPAAAIDSEDDYPFWTHVTSILLTPFTGASGTLNF